MKLKTAIERIMQLIDEYSVRGSVSGSTDGNVADYYRKVRNLIDIAQKRVAETRYILRTKEYLHYVPKTPYLGLYSTQKEFSFAIKRAYAYSFVIIGSAVAVIEGVGETVETLETIVCADGAYSERLDPIKDYDSVRIRFDSDTPFMVKSPALFETANFEKIPFVAQYVQYPLPDNYYQFIKSEIELPTGLTTEYSDFNFEQIGSIGLAINRQGIVKLTYAVYPKTITGATPDDHELELDPNGISAMCLYASALLIQLEDYSAYTQFMTQYLDIMANSTNKVGFRQSRVKRVW